MIVLALHHTHTQKDSFWSWNNFFCLLPDRTRNRLNNTIIIVEKNFHQNYYWRDNKPIGNFFFLPTCIWPIIIIRIIWWPNPVIVIIEVLMCVCVAYIDDYIDAKIQCGSMNSINTWMIKGFRKCHQRQKKRKFLRK